MAESEEGPEQPGDVSRDVSEAENVMEGVRLYNEHRRKGIDADFAIGLGVAIGLITWLWKRARR